MIEILNKLINILVGTSNLDYILTLRGLETSYAYYINEFVGELIGTYDFETDLFIQLKYTIAWFFSNPQVIISFVFYLLCAWAIFYFCLIVPYRFIKSFLPKAIRGGKQ